MKLGQYDGWVWVKDLDTGLRYRWPESLAKVNDRLQILNVPVTQHLDAAPTSTRTTGPRRRQATATASTAADNTEAEKEATS